MNRSFVFKYAIPVYNPKNPEQVVLTKTEFEIYHVLVPRMGQRYRADRYDTLINNCNHFTEEFLREITGQEFGLPGFLNRAAYIGSWFHCLIPARWLNVAPDQEESESNALSNVNASATQSRGASTSYSLLCNENILSWTVSAGANNDDHAIGGYVDRSDYRALDGETMQL